MTRDDIIRATFQAGVAAERKRQEEQLHTCNATCDRPLCVARRKGAEEEREACAQLAERWGQEILVETWDMAGKDIAKAIRARSKT